MTLAQIETAVRALIKEQSTEVGALFPADNILLDFYIDTAAAMVVMDLVPFMKETFLTSEFISLVSGTTAYTLTGTPLQYWAMLRNVTAAKPGLIKQYTLFQMPYRNLLGETAADPLGWYESGEKTINFFPIPSASTASYAKLWYIPMEASSMVAGGPAVIPGPAHRLIPLKAASLISLMNDEGVDRYDKVYREFLRAVQVTYAGRIQQQPKTLLPAFHNRINIETTRDRAFYDESGVFEDL